MPYKDRQKQLEYQREYNKNYCRKYGKEERERSKQYYNNHKEQCGERSKQYYMNNIELRRWTQIHRKFHLGLTWQETRDIWMGQFKLQNGLCLICRENPATETDHNHITGEFRGILCPQCNQAIGLLKTDEKDIDFLLAAISYIKGR